MVGEAVGLYELNIKSPKLTRRGGRDANTPEWLFCEIDILDYWPPHVGKYLPMDPQKMNMDFQESRIGPNEQLMNFPE